MTDRSLRVAAVGITPPVFKASGGISAGIQLTRHIAEICEAQFVLMSTENSVAEEDGLRLVRRKPRNLIGALSSVVPARLVSLMWRPDLSAWLAAERPSIVHLHNPHPPGAMAQVARDCLRLGIPYVISTHGFVEFNDLGAAERAAWRKPVYDRLIKAPVAYAARNAARVLMLSPEEAPILRSMGVPSNRLDVVTNGLDHYFGSAIPDADRASLTARFSIPSDLPVVFFVGNHTPNKGLDVLLRALQLQKERAVVVVGGAIRSAAENAALLSDVGLKRDDPRLIFTDFMTKEELRALYQRADIFAFPSYADTLPLVILEAMASGLPVVATRVGGIPYEVTAETGILVGPGKPADFAAALDRLCAAKSLRQVMGAAGRARVLEVFDWRASAVKAVSIYRELLGTVSR